MKFSDWSKLKIFNMFFFQWLFMRAFKIVEDDRMIAAGIMFPVVPLTGWGFRFLPDYVPNKEWRVSVQVGWN